MYETGVMTADERAQAADWAAREGWNPGAQDMACFQVVDPDGFWAGRRDGRMQAAISVVNYDARFAFLGFYIVRPEARGQGLGYQLWQAALAHAGDRVVGLDGVVDQQDNYRTSGFDLAFRNIRFGGARPEVAMPGGVELQPVTAPDAALQAMDARVFPAVRTAFWQAWLSAPGHRAMRAVQDGRMVGFATRRPCRDGYKIGPLVARDVRVAQALLAGLLTDLPAGAPVFWDVPEPNAAAVGLARDLGLTPVFETARMYRGPAPQLDLDVLYGVTSFELG